MKIFRIGQALLPAAFWALFALLTLFFNLNSHWIDSARGFLGAILPLLGGISAAYAVLDDPALEILFATPLRAGRFLAERIVPPFLIIIGAAISFQIFLFLLGLDLGLLGGTVSFQFTWLVPTLALTGLGAAVSLAARNCAGGALAVGAVWIIQLIARGWFLSQEGAGVFLLFLGIFRPSDSRLTANRIVCSILAAALLFTAAVLLKKQERYI